MNTLSLSLTQLIHDNISVLMTFAFSRKPLELLTETRFKGEWKFCSKAFFTLSEQRAAKSCIELASFLRLLDDQENISGYLKQKGGHGLGRVIKQGQSEEILYLRDLTNKIMHAANFEWDFSNPDNPTLICISNQPKRWGSAEIDLVALAAFCCQLMS
jgi:hypothetical protein